MRCTPQAAAAAPTVWFAAMAVSAASAAPPVLDAISRRGVERGKPTVLTITGKNLTADVRILLPVAIEKQEVRKQPAPTAARVEIELTVAAAAPPGVHPMRIANGEGVSAMVLFEVGATPEFDEVEPNNSFEQATAVASLPAVYNGSAAGQDVDTYKIRLKSGQRLTAEVVSQRLGNALLPVLELCGPTKQLAAAGQGSALLGADARLTFTAPTDGDYYVQVHDLLYRGGAPAQYRLKLGDWAYADAVYPLGGRRGGPLEVEFVGGSLTAPVKATADLRVAAEIDRLPVRLPESASPEAPPHLLAVGDLPEVLEGPTGDGKPQAAEGPVVLNGRIGAARETDRWAVKLAPGKWRAEVAAASLGSPLVPVLELQNPAGATLAVAPDRADSFDTQIDFDVTDKNPVTVIAITDLHRRGGIAFGYRITVRPLGKPDFALTVDSDTANVPAGAAAVLRVKASRSGYAGSIALTVEGLPAGAAASGAVIPANENDALLCLSAPPGAAASPGRWTIVGEGATPEGKLRRIAKRVAMLAPEGGPAASPYVSAEVLGGIGGPPPIRLLVAPPTTPLMHGVPFTLNLTLDRNPAGDPTLPAAAAGLMELASLPAAGPALRAGLRIDPEAEGVVNLAVLTNLLGPNPAKGGAVEQLFVAAAPNSAIKAGAEAGQLVVTVDPKSPLRTIELAVQGTLLNKANQPIATVIAPGLSLEIVEPYKVEFVEGRATIAPGGKAVIAGRVKRRPGFAGVVEIKPTPPAGYMAAAVKVPADKTDFSIGVTAPANAKPGDVPLPLASSWAIDAKTNYQPPPLTVTLAVQPPPVVPKAEPKPAKPAEKAEPKK